MDISTRAQASKDHTRRNLAAMYTRMTNDTNLIFIGRFPNILKYVPGNCLFDQFFVIYRLPRDCNMHTGPLSILYLSMEARSLIHYPDTLKDVLEFSCLLKSTQATKLIEPHMLEPEVKITTPDLLLQCVPMDKQF